jgi:uncharacterized membrane-anchored protein YitT (DUF2179 family)
MHRISSSNSILPLLISTVIAGLLAAGLSFLLSPILPSPMASQTLPVGLAVSIALLSTSAWRQGWSNLSGSELLRALAGGIGAGLGVWIMLWLT